jgi:hypothetical protein
MLTACATTNQNANTFAKIRYECTTKYDIRYRGDCMENYLNQYLPSWRDNIHASYVSAYLEWTKAAGAKVANGDMDEMEAIRGSNDLFNRINVQARADQEQQRQANLMMFLNGLAIMGNANQPLPSAFNSTTYVMPNNRMITCTESVGHNFVSCR